MVGRMGGMGRVGRQVHWTGPVGRNVYTAREYASVCMC